MIGVVDTGDGMRGVFSAGVLERCLDDGVEFDEHVGVSSGAANLAYFITKQKEKNYNFYGHYSFRPAYMGWFHKLRNNNFYNLDYIYGTIAKEGGENPLNFESLMDSDKAFVVGISDAAIGEPRFFDGKDMVQDDYGLIKASWCEPGLNEPYFWKGFEMYDGAVTAPIPVKRALEDGCERAVVILTTPRNYYRRDLTDAVFARSIRGKYPDMSHAAEKRASLYNQQLEECKALEAEGKVLILAPPDTYGMSPRSRDPRKIKKMFAAGYEAGAEVKAFLEQPMGGRR